jgi:polysaccharide export outer membrane protein
MKISFYLSVIVVMLFSGCSTQSFKMFDGNNTVVKTVSDKEYIQETQFEWKIAKDDRVEISIVNQTSGEGDQQLSQMLSQGGSQQTLTRDGTEGTLIPNDGVVRLPLIGSVSILNLTENQAADKISNLYKAFLRHPYVTVKILNQKLFVLGEVKGPGVIQVTNGTMSLFEALARTGDLTTDADRTNIRVIRGGLRNPQVRDINLADMSQMKLTSLILLPNDIIYVQPRAMKAYNIAFVEQTPFFNMLGAMMSPFITFDTLRSTRAVNVIFK